MIITYLIGICSYKDFISITRNVHLADLALGRRPYGKLLYFRKDIVFDLYYCSC